jgi:hypothetical protein
MPIMPCRERAVLARQRQAIISVGILHLHLTTDRHARRVHMRKRRAVGLPQRQLAAVTSGPESSVGGAAGRPDRHIAAVCIACKSHDVFTARRPQVEASAHVVAPK